MARKLFFTVLLGILLCCEAALAQEKSQFNTSGLDIPRFVSLKSDKVYVRAGPGLRYPIKWIYKKDSLPIEVVQEFDTWRKIRDIEGDEGWVHQTLLSGKRTALVIEEKGSVLLRKPQTDGTPVAILEPKVIVVLEECSGAWCLAASGGFKGWIERKSLWGVYPEEELE
jgi:SH3-like domain-containing protein